MSSFTIEQAQARLPELLKEATPGDEIIITDEQRPVARIIIEPAAAKRGARLGTMRGSVLYMAEDFDAPLDDFREYMP